MAVSAASATYDDLQRQYDEANMQDMTLQERQQAGLHGEQRVSRRCHKTGKAFQNYRRAQLNLLQGMIHKKIFFIAWHREVKMRDERCA